MPKSSPVAGRDYSLATAHCLALVFGGQILVDPPTVFDPGKVVLGNGSHNTTGRAHDNAVGRDDFTGRDQRSRTNNAIGPDYAVVQQDAAHANNAVSLDPAPVQDCAVPNRSPRTNSGFRVSARVMGNGSVLDIGVLADGNQSLIATKNNTGPNAYARGQLHLANHSGVGVHPSGDIDFRVKITIGLDHDSDLKSIFDEDIAHGIRVNEHFALDNNGRVAQTRPDLMASGQVVGSS
jgi:hypothetical protein